jgi:uncharacterized membrane protein YjjP (DUF1212 family)/uncharacterized membrane protein YjjB (DUF3815 family)
LHTEEFKLKRKFIVRIGKMLHKFGIPAYRLESHLMNLANALELRSSFIISPTSMTFVLWTEGHEDEYTHAARVEPGDLDLGSLSRTDDVIEAVIDGEMALVDATAKLDEIETMPNSYGRIATGFSYCIASGAFALLMRGSIYEVALAASIGLLVYIFVLWSERSKGIHNMLEPLVALVASFVAYGVAASFNPAIGVKLVTLSSIIVFIPGLALTIGLNELSSRHLVSGTVKVMDALMMLFKLYFGAYLGMELGKYSFGQYEALPSGHLPPFVMWIAILMLSISLIIAFRTRKKHIVWSLLIAFLSFGVSSVATTHFGIAVGAFIGAFVVGIYSNLFTRLANSPGVIVAMQGLIVLVPGSKTFISLNTYVEGAAGFAFAEYAGQQALVIFMSIVAGLIFANSALPPKKSL